MITDEMVQKFAADTSQGQNKDIHLKRVNYKTHEFIKLNTVKQMVNEVTKTVMEKLAEKDKQITSLKTVVRSLDQKQKNTDAQVTSLTRLSKQVADHHAKIKALITDLETQTN